MHCHCVFIVLGVHWLTGDVDEITYSLSHRGKRTGRKSEVATSAAASAAAVAAVGASAATNHKFARALHGCCCFISAPYIYIHIHC